MPIFGTTSPSCPPPPNLPKLPLFHPIPTHCSPLKPLLLLLPSMLFAGGRDLKTKKQTKKAPNQHKMTPKIPPPPPQKPQNGGISPQNGAHLPCDAIQVPLPLRGQFASAAKKDHFCAQNAPKMGEMNPKWDGGGLKGAPSLFCAQNAPKMGEMNSKWGWGGRGGLKGAPSLFVLKMPQNWEK